MDDTDTHIGYGEAEGAPCGCRGVCVEGLEARRQRRQALGVFSDRVSGYYSLRLQLVHMKTETTDPRSKAFFS